MENFRKHFKNSVAKILPIGLEIERAVCLPKAHYSCLYCLPLANHIPFALILGNPAPQSKGKMEWFSCMVIEPIRLTCPSL